MRSYHVLNYSYFYTTFNFQYVFDNPKKYEVVLGPREKENRNNFFFSSNICNLMECHSFHPFSRGSEKQSWFLRFCFPIDTLTSVLCTNISTHTNDWYSVICELAVKYKNVEALVIDYVPFVLLAMDARESYSRNFAFFMQISVVRKSWKSLPPRTGPTFTILVHFLVLIVRWHNLLEKVDEFHAVISWTYPPQKSSFVTPFFFGTSVFLV